MRYMKIKPIDIADGPGVRVSLFVSGCRNHCPGCFNAEAWDFNAGEEFTDSVFKDLIHRLAPNFIAGLTILGGDPMEPENLPEVTKICKAAKFAYPHKTIWLYTGYRFEDFSDSEIMQYIDVCVDGRFIEAQKNLSLRFCGSSNQRLIDVKESLAQGKVALWNDWQTRKEGMK